MRSRLKNNQIKISYKASWKIDGINGAEIYTISPWKRYVITYFIFIGLACFIASYYRTEGFKTAYAEKKERVVYISPTPTPEVIKSPTTEQKQIVGYIRQVFGKDSSRAFQLLSCENSSFNPNAVNTAGNSPQGSKDIGVFQINEFWQAVQGKFLFNWRTNVEIAHDIYVQNGNFGVWTCGRKLGI